MDAKDSTSPVVLSLPQGQIKGAKCTTLYDQSYHAFERIPYAKPPIGKLRFKAPVPADAWSGVLDCTESPERPMQKNKRTGQIIGSEDCLYLNVYTKLESKTSLPVMVWIYGGAFQTGRASRDHHGPDYLMREDIVLVSFNYRVCSLGFLSLKDPAVDVPGNAGLKDQILALQWIKANIAHFNGDCNNITVFGESAGGSALHCLLFSERSKGLIDRAILMSGCALNFWTFTPPNDMAFRLAKCHGYTGENKDSSVLEYLQSLKPELLVDHTLMTDEELLNFYWLSFTPVVEPYTSEHCVLSAPPRELLSSSWSNNIPMIIGGTSFEGLLVYQRLKNLPKIVQAVKQYPSGVVPVELKAKCSTAEAEKLGKQLLSLYFGKAVQTVAEENQSMMCLVSDKYFWHGFYETVQARLKYASAPTFLYRFDFDSPTFNHHRLRYVGADPVRGVAHADDLSYLFLLPEATKLKTDSAEYKTIQRMVGIWTAFAKRADPNCDEIKPHNWAPVQKECPEKGLNISDEISIMEVMDKTKLEAWNGIN